MFKSLIILLVLTLNFGFAATYYVDTNHPSASDNNPGTEASPFKTIQKGIDVANAGDNVLVKNGTYSPGSSGLNMVRSGTAGAKIVFSAYPGHSPVIQFPSSNSPERGWNWSGYKDYLVIDGFEIIGAKYAVLVQGSYNEVLNCKVHDTGSDALAVWGGSYNRIAYNEVYNSGWNGIYIESREYNGAHGKADYNIVEYNNSHNNSSHFGINIFPETSHAQTNLVGNIIRYNYSHHNGGGVYLRRFKDGEIYGNVIYMNGSTSSGNGLFFHKSSGDSQPFLSNTKVYNNTLDDNDPYWNTANDVFEGCDFKNNIFMNANIRHAYSTTQDYNLYYNSTGDISGSNNVTGNPLVNSDYTLQANSPAINAGVNLGSPYNIDMNGNIRGNDGGWDIGAFEMYFGPDITPPDVTGASLTDSTHLVINFSEALDPGTAQNSSNYSITGDVSVNNAVLSGSTVTLTTSTHPVGSYTVTVSNVTDLAGNVVNPAANSANYSRTPPPDLIPPKVTGAVLLDSVTLRVDFSENLQQSSAQNENNYAITGGITVQNALLNGTQVTLTTSVHPTGNYTLTVSNVLDLVGNTIDPAANSAQYSWTAGPDITPPQVASASLLDSVTLKIIFSESLEQSSAQNTSNYSINNGINVTGASVSGAEVTLNTSIHAVGTYTVTVVNVQDLAGNQIQPPNNNAGYERVENPGNNFEKLTILSSEASAVPEPEHSPDKTYDGMSFFHGDPDSRWAGQPIPAWISYDIGQEKLVSMSKLSFYNWNQGRIYNYSLEVSSDNFSWTTVVANANSSSDEWIENEFTPTSARYFRVVFNSSNQGNWAGLWEVEIWGDSPTNEEEPENNLPQDFSLMQNYPNPFNPSTKIQFNIGEQTHVFLKIFNSLGEEVTELVNSGLSPGNYEYTFDANGLSSGIYFYTVIAGNFVQTKKMILLK